MTQTLTRLLLIGLLLMPLPVPAQMPIQDAKRAQMLATLQILVVSMHAQEQALASCRQFSKAPAECAPMQEALTLIRQQHAALCREHTIPSGTAQCP